MRADLSNKDRREPIESVDDGLDWIELLAALRNIPGTQHEHVPQHMHVYKYKINDIEYQRSKQHNVISETFQQMTLHPHVFL